MGLLYQKRRLKVNKIKRKIAANRVLLIRIKMFLSLLLIIAIAYFCYCSLKLPQWYINTEKLAKASSDVLKIQGNIITPDYKIINMVRQTQLPYTQIFRLDTTELENNISQLAPVKKVYVRRYWFPARLVINVDERIPAFLLAPNLESEPNSALTTDGILIDHDYLPLNQSIKTKKLLTYGVKDGLDEVWDKKRVEEILKLTKAIEAYSNQEVQYIDLRNQKDVYIMLEEYLIRLGEINATSLNRTRWIASILPEAQKYNKKVKYIDLRWDDSYYLRLKESKEEVKKELTKKPLKEENKNEENIENEETVQARQAAKIQEETIQEIEQQE
ncbi:MAG: FtsQ-type POTRA domain-containing protein [Candidatus Gastranaerophilales bacterium]|nr:FtsQ-type POTRA domain-containing protein [Candidatus Gastranaerophilales bacterium]